MTWIRHQTQPGAQRVTGEHLVAVPDPIYQGPPPPSHKTTLAHVAEHWLGKALFRTVVVLALAVCTFWVERMDDRAEATMALVRELQTDVRRDLKEIRAQLSAVESTLGKRITDLEKQGERFKVQAERWDRDISKWEREFDRIRSGRRKP